MTDFDARAARAQLRALGLPTTAINNKGAAPAEAFAVVDAYSAEALDRALGIMRRPDFPYRIADTRRVPAKGRLAARTSIYISAPGTGGQEGTP